MWRRGELIVAFYEESIFFGENGLFFPDRHPFFVLEVGSWE
jgi:hypothetical protein